MKNWIHRNERERLDLLNVVAAQERLPNFMIEKDWWVTMALECIFTCELHPHFAFKGGTSLSKCWNLLNRFSEDIDIVIDKTLFGIKENESISKAKKDKLRKDAHKFIVETVTPKLNERMLAMGIPANTFKLSAETSEVSDGDPTVILLDYQSQTEINNSYTEPRVKIEIGVRALMEPSEQRLVKSLLGEHLKNDESIAINTILPQRTFWEKLFLLHELFQKPLDKMKIARMSRHWYDINQLSKAGFAKKAMEDKELYLAIRNHRKIFTKVSGVNYDTLSPKEFGLFPPPEKTEDWNRDYDKMIESYIYRDSPSLVDLLKSIQEITDTLAKLDY